jgi:DoxX-like family
MNRGVTEGRVRRSAGSILIVLAGFALVSSAIVKFARVSAVVSQMAASGFADGKLTLVASLELLSAALFLVPRTRSIGVLVLSAFLGGAICSHVQLGQFAKAIGPSILLGLSWVGTYLRDPEVLWSFAPQHAESTLIADSKSQHLAPERA